MDHVECTGYLIAVLALMVSAAELVFKIYVWIQDRKNNVKPPRKKRLH